VVVAMTQSWRPRHAEQPAAWQSLAPISYAGENSRIKVQNVVTDSWAREQAEGRLEAIGPGTDIFGLGAILYELLTGRPPFEGAALEEVLAQARQGQVRRPRQLNPQVPRSLERICLKALAADSEQRYPSAAALAEDLRHYLRRPTRLVLTVGALCGLLLSSR
jgi:serine/threonine protein kinase